MLDMTVGVVAMTQNVIFAASDQMITAGDIQFEAGVMKIAPVTNSIFIVHAGDTGLYAEVYAIVRQRVNDYLAHSSEKPLPVVEAVDWYVSAYAYVKSKRAEAAVLGPIAQNLTSYAAEHSSLRSDVVKQLTAELQDYNPGGVEAIIAGIDSTGAHIHKVWNGIARCEDALGFSAIGNGAEHAEGQFMMWPIPWRVDVGQTLLLTYVAKRRAEIAPGVGRATDLITVGPDLYSLKPVVDEAVVTLPKLYARLQKDEQRTATTAGKGMLRFSVELAEKRRMAPAQATEAEAEAHE